jgi:Fic family protein
MLPYNWQQKDWLTFTYTLHGLETLFTQIVRNEGKYDGIVGMLPKQLQVDTIIDLMVIEAIKTSAIEGEVFSRKDVISSIKKNLGIAQKAYKVTNQLAEGISEVMVDVRKTFAKPLSKNKLLTWHKTLFTGTKDIQVGKWRTHAEPMQIVSGAIGKQKVHFEAPPSKRVPTEMNKFIEWFNNTAPGQKKEIKYPVVRAAIAHLYFESIHPFEDGNGRIGRAIAEKALSQGAGKPVLLSLSATIEKNKKVYYNALHAASTTNDVSKWIKYFVQTVADAQKMAEAQINFTLKKVAFFEKYTAILSKRQLKAIHRMFSEGADGFEGGMNATKYGSLNKISKATATRDLQELLLAGVLNVLGAGRNTRYSINL